MKLFNKIDHAIVHLGQLSQELKNIQGQLPSYKRVRVGNAHLCAAMECVGNARLELKRLASRLEEDQEERGGSHD